MSGGGRTKKRKSGKQESGWDAARELTTKISRWKPRNKLLLALFGAFVCFVLLVMFTSSPESLKATRANKPQ